MIRLPFDAQRNFMRYAAVDMIAHHTRFDEPPWYDASISCQPIKIQLEVVPAEQYLAPISPTKKKGGAIGIRRLAEGNGFSVYRSLASGLTRQRREP
jgi:hypothetical protein